MDPSPKDGLGNVSESGGGAINPLGKLSFSAGGWNLTRNLATFAHTLKIDLTYQKASPKVSRPIPSSLPPPKKVASTTLKSEGYLQPSPNSRSHGWPKTTRPNIATWKGATLYGSYPSKNGKKTFA